jgi:DNA-binding NtrC family response regulator
VLVVDDDAALLEIYADLLREAGYAVETAPSGREALQVVQSQHIDVLMTDIGMPDTDGIELLRAVRERDLDLPVLLATGGPTLETRASRASRPSNRRSPSSTCPWCAASTPIP